MACPIPAVPPTTMARRAVALPCNETICMHAHTAAWWHRTASRGTAPHRQQRHRTTSSGTARQAAAPHRKQRHRTASSGTAPKAAAPHRKQRSHALRPSRWETITKGGDGGDGGVGNGARGLHPHLCRRDAVPGQDREGDFPGAEPRSGAVGGPRNCPPPPPSVCTLPHTPCVVHLHPSLVALVCVRACVCVHVQLVLRTLNDAKSAFAAFQFSAGARMAFCGRRASGRWAIGFEQANMGCTTRPPPPPSTHQSVCFSPAGVRAMQRSSLHSIHHRGGL
jgi:hypothetical protein